MRSDALHAGLLALALTLSALGGSVRSGRGVPVARHGPTLTSAVTPERQADGSWVLRDAGGTALPLRHYARIASGTLIADRVLSDLCEPTRVVAFTMYGAEGSRDAHRYRGKATLASRASVEKVLMLRPDLLIVNNLVDPGYVTRLREHGIAIFDLGHMRGLDTLLLNIQAIGILIGAPERATAYAASLSRHMQAVNRQPPEHPRPRALYLSVYADHLYGGAGRTSYHDVLEHAGLSDVAAGAGLDGWPELTAERVLALNPEVLVTKQGMGAVLCRHPGLTSLRPCANGGALVELDGTLLDDPGPTMLEATEALYDAYWHGGAR